VLACAGVIAAGALTLPFSYRVLAAGRDAALAATAEREGDVVEALERIESAMRLGPASTAYHVRAADLLDRFRLTTQGVDDDVLLTGALAGVAEGLPYAPLSLTLNAGVSERALELARRGRTAYLDVGIAALRRAADLYPNAYLAQQNLTTHLLAAGLADGALEGGLRMEALAQGAETRATARYLQGAALSSLGRTGEARTALEGALAEGPSEALAEAITALLDELT
jgi:hypothetical protein